MHRLGLASLVATQPCRERDLVLAMVASRIVGPDTKLATTRRWHTSTLAEDFGRQDTLQAKLAARDLSAGGLVLYDLPSSYFEGRTCPLARRGYSRDGKPGTLQVNYGLLTNARGCPAAVSVFEGNTADSKTFMPAVKRVREEFGLQQVVMVGDRSMVTQKAIDELRESDGMGWITALKSTCITELPQFRPHQNVRCWAILKKQALENSNIGKAFTNDKASASPFGVRPLSSLDYRVTHKPPTTDPFRVEERQTASCRRADGRCAPGQDGRYLG